MGGISHHGFLSPFKYNNLPDVDSAWITTTEANQVIRFLESDGTQRQANSLTIFSETKIFVRIGLQDVDESCVIVEALEPFDYHFEKLEGIQIMAPAGTKFYYYAQYY